MNTGFDRARAMARSQWNYYPWYLTGFMAVVFAINGLMVYDALTTFPGQAGENGFDLGNRYAAIEKADAAQDALGWVARTDTVSAQPVVMLSAKGADLAGATVTAVAVRPLGPRNAQTLSFHEVAPGRYLAAQSLPLPGQWDLQLHVLRDGHAMLETRRVIVK